uniref:Aerolysin-like C-terminal domain-containing protein n=1 Tax=Oncorhynchus tshawytscha TaxID=74940 RepID=A0A8C8J5S8_ONCTS
LNMATRLKTIGGGGGMPFEFHGMKNGATLKKIGVTVEGWQVKAVWAELTDGRVATFGEGRSGSDIDCMGFVFINAVKSTVLNDMKYPTLSLFKPQVTPEYVKSISHHNDTSLVQEESATYSKTVTKTSSWSISNKIESTLEVTVKAGIPNLVELSSGFSLAVGVEQSSSLEKSESITESDTINVKIPPGKTMDVEITVGKANIDLDYGAKVKITCMNGSQLVFPSKGIYTDLHFNDHYKRVKVKGYISHTSYTLQSK